MSGHAVTRADVEVLIVPLLLVAPLCQVMISLNHLAYSVVQAPHVNIRINAVLLHLHRDQHFILTPPTLALEGDNTVCAMIACMIGVTSKTTDLHDITSLLSRKFFFFF